MSENAVKKERPLSPHLQVYRPEITSISSILHRICGIVLMLGLFIVTWGLMALAGGRESFQVFTDFMGSTLGQFILIDWSAAFFYHMCTGIRHFILDSGYLFEREIAAKSGFVCIGAAAFLTAVLWALIYLGGA